MGTKPRGTRGPRGFDFFRHPESHIVLQRQESPGVLPSARTLGWLLRGSQVEPLPRSGRSRCGALLRTAGCAGYPLGKAIADIEENGCPSQRWRCHPVAFRGLQTWVDSVCCRSQSDRAPWQMLRGSSFSPASALSRSLAIDSAHRSEVGAVLLDATALLHLPAQSRPQHRGTGRQIDEERRVCRRRVDIFADVHIADR